VFLAPPLTILFQETYCTVLWSNHILVVVTPVVVSVGVGVVVVVVVRIHVLHTNVGNSHCMKNGSLLRPCGYEF